MTEQARNKLATELHNIGQTAQVEAARLTGIPSYDPTSALIRLKADVQRVIAGVRAGRRQATRHTSEYWRTKAKDQVTLIEKRAKVVLHETTPEALQEGYERWVDSYSPSENYKARAKMLLDNDLTKLAEFRRRYARLEARDVHAD